MIYVFLFGALLVGAIYFFMLSFFASSSKSVKNHVGTSSASPSPTTSGFSAIRDKYETIEEVQEMLRRAGLESSNLIMAIDYTKSNEYNGRTTFGGKSLHDLSGPYPNPYEQCIRIIGFSKQLPSNSPPPPSKKPRPFLC